MTLSITWMMPLLHAMSALTTLASSIRTPFVDDAVAARDVGFDDVGVVDPDAIIDGDRDTLTVEGRRFGHVHDARGIDATRHDVIRQDRRQESFVLRLEQRLDRARRELGEGRVGRGKDRERAVTLERLDQVGSRQGSGERLE
jgi:hypothetical protein